MYKKEIILILSIAFCLTVCSLLFFIRMKEIDKVQPAQEINHNNYAEHKELQNASK
jgi:hypothetical protein